MIKALTAKNEYRHTHGLDTPVCVGDATPLEAAIQAWRLDTATCDGMDATAYAILMLDEQANVALTAIQFIYFPL